VRAGAHGERQRIAGIGTGVLVEEPVGAGEIEVVETDEGAVNGAGRRLFGRWAGRAELNERGEEQQWQQAHRRRGSTRVRESYLLDVDPTTSGPV